MRVRFADSCFRCDNRGVIEEYLSKYTELLALAKRIGNVSVSTEPEVLCMGKGVTPEGVACGAQVVAPDITIEVDGTPPALDDFPPHLQENGVSDYSDEQGD